MSNNRICGSGDRIVVTAADGSTHEADRLIVTAPIVALRDQMAFTPDLPEEMRTTLDEADVWGGFKAFVEFTEQFYPTSLVLDGRNTDKRDLLAIALADSSVHPNEATMIGDRAHDAIGASHNAMDFVGVLYGYGSEEELEDEGTTRFVYEPRELIPALAMP